MSSNEQPTTIPILLVDDRPENLLSLEGLLEGQGYELIRALSGNEALRLTLKHDCALVLLDVQMPEMDGFETAELMRLNPKTRHIPIIFVTAGMKEIQFQFKGYDAGAVDYLLKPIEPLILKSKVQVFVELYRQRKELELHRNRLSELVEQRTQELNRARLNAESANRSKSRFLATMSHEIRTPMNGVLGMLALLQGSGLSEEQQEYVAQAAASSRDLVKLLDDILDISRIEAEKMELICADFALQPLIEQTISLLAPQAQDKGIRLSATIDDTIPAHLKGDAGRLRQILINLISNGIKFTRQGSVSVRGRLESRHDHRVLLCFEVCDTGIGIPLEKQELIFEPFTQVDDTPTRSYGGTGLGLAICRQLVQLMQGTITVESSYDNGSIFRFTALLEAADGPQPEQTEPLKGPKEEDTGVDVRHSGHYRILLAEDELTNQTVTQKMLMRAGYLVDVANNGKEALSALEQHDYDLVLMDCMMPVINGYEATALIRDPVSKVRNHAVPIIALTANAMKEDHDLCLAAGMDDYHAKPIEYPQLLAQLEQWLKQTPPKADR